MLFRSLCHILLPSPLVHIQQCRAPPPPSLLLSQKIGGPLCIKSLLILLSFCTNLASTCLNQPAHQTQRTKVLTRLNSGCTGSLRKLCWLSPTFCCARRQGGQAGRLQTIIGRAPREAVPTPQWTEGFLGQLRVFQAGGQELRKGEPKWLCADVECYYYYTRRRARRRSLQLCPSFPQI